MLFSLSISPSGAYLFTPASGGGGGGYTTGAVAFNGATWLRNPALVATDGPSLTVSAWYYFSDGPTNTQVPWVSDPENAYNNNAAVEYSAVPPDVKTFLANGSDNGRATGNLATGSWQHHLFSMNTQTRAGSYYINGVGQPGAIVWNGTTFDVLWNGLSFWVGADGFDGDQYNQALADFWFAPGQFIDLTDAANRAKFISGGKPVDLGADGSTPTGTAPAVFLRAAPGNEAASFATNLGTGGDFTVTGALTAAASSPSG